MVLTTNAKTKKKACTRMCICLAQFLDFRAACERRDYDQVQEMLAATAPQQWAFDYDKEWTTADGLWSDGLEIPGSRVATVLTAAVRFGDATIVKWVLAKGADPKAASSSTGFTALDVALLSWRPGHSYETVQVLLKL